MRRCPKCKGSVLYGECINCGWSGTAEDEAEPEKPTTPPQKAQGGGPRTVPIIDRELQAQREEVRRKKHHSAYQKRNPEKVKAWHDVSYARRKARKEEENGGNSGAEEVR